MRSFLVRPYGLVRAAWSALGRSTWLQVAALFAVAIAINWKLLTNPGECVVWGNFALPCTGYQYSVYAPLEPVWNPYSFMGAPTAIPVTVALTQLTALWPETGLSSVLGPPGAAAAYAILTTTFVGVTFLFFARGVIVSRWGRFAAAVLVIVAPFQLQLYGEGDFSTFVALGFAFLAAYFLGRAALDVQRRWIWYPLSVGCLVMTAASLQILLLGLLLYVIALIAYTVIIPGGPLRARLVTLGLNSIRFLALPLALAPLWLPALYSAPISLGPSSTYATPLAVFSSLSAPPAAVFVTLGYVWSSGTGWSNFVGFAMVSTSVGSIPAAAWAILVILSVLGVWTGVALLRDRRGIYLLAVAVLAALIGAGPNGPLASAATFLYVHVAGYQVLNASYFWDWAIIVPSLALALGILIERTIDSPGGSSHAPSALPGVSPTKEPSAVGPGLRVRRSVWSRASRPLGWALAAALVVTVAMPYAAGAQNGPVENQSVGIQSTPYPTDYATLPSRISGLVGSSYAGVAVFNPYVEWLPNGSGRVFQNYFYYFPTVRTPTLPGYAIPPFPSTFYAYWAYEQLYTNSTPYVGQLLSLMGIQYLLVFYGTQPAPSTALAFSNGQNVSRLLEYQSGIVPAYASKSFAIYRDLYYAGTAASLANLSVVAGSYDELSVMASAGVNLTGQGIVYPSDIPAGQCGAYLAHVDRIYANSTNALYGIALPCTAASSVSPLSYLPVGQIVWDGWASSYSSVSGSLGANVSSAWPAPLAVTFGGPHTLSLPVDTSGCASCSIWALVRVGQDGGNLTFDWSGSVWTLDTNQSSDALTNAMVWVELPYTNLGASGTLSITSDSGWNALGPVYAASDAAVTNWLQNEAASKTIILTSRGGASLFPDQPEVIPVGGSCSAAEVVSPPAPGACVAAPTSPGHAPASPLAQVSDLSATGTWSVSSQPDGYSLSGPATLLVLVRVPFYSNLVLSPGLASLTSATGSVDSLIWNPGGSTQFEVRPASIGTLNVGYSVMAVTLFGLGGVEYLILWIGRRAKRRAASASVPRPAA